MFFGWMSRFGVHLQPVGSWRHSPRVTISNRSIAASGPSAKGGFTHESRRAATVEWLTPPFVFAALNLTFDLDVCSPGAGKTFVPARRHYTVEDDGLALPWEGLVWCNPPYGNATGVWLRKLAAHGNGIAMVFSRTDTAWFQDSAASASALCFMGGRVKFINGHTQRPAGSPGAGSVLIGYGDTARAALLQSGLGLCFEPTTRP